jgi:putative endonuclease
MRDWYVYVLKSLHRGKEIHYTGATNDPDRRLRQHNGELAGGARFTRRFRPWDRVALYGPFDGRGEAQRVERLIKSLRPAARLAASFPSPGTSPHPTPPEGPAS